MADLLPTAYISGLKVRQRISRAQPKGLPIINMGYNELPYPPPAAVQQVIAQMAGQAHRYGTASCADLRQALAAEHGVDADQLICGNGSEELLDVIARCFVRPGDKIVIPEFGYIQFSIIAHRLGARLIKAAETDFAAGVDAILGAVDEQTKLVFLANPNNPTGTMLPVEELARLARTLPGNVVLVLDLAYGEFVGADYCARVHELVSAHENVAVTRTFSKVYGLAGLRAGWCHAPAWMLPGLSAARGMGSVNGFAQAAAIAALGERDVIMTRAQEICAERDKLWEALSELPLTVVQSHTNFIMCGFPGDDGTLVDALTTDLFDEAGLVVGPVREEGLEGFIRFSLSLPEHNALLLRTVKDFVRSRG